MSNQAVFAGQLWRLFTAPLTSGGLLGTLMVLLVLWIAGRAIESELGSWRMVALYFAAGLGGTTLLFVFGPLSGAGYAGSAAASACWPRTRSSSTSSARTYAPTSACSCCSSCTACWSGSTTSAG